MTKLRIIAIAVVSILILQWTGLVNFGLSIGSQSLSVVSKPERLSKPQDSYAIGLFYNETTYPGFLAGARRAAAEVNAGGGLAGNPLELIEVDETDLSWREAERNLPARRKVDQAHTIAAIGHTDRPTMTRARAFFNDAGIVHVNALVFDTGLSKPDFRYSISTLPTIQELGAGIVAAVMAQGAGSLAILGDRSRVGLELRVALADAAAQQGLKVPFNRTRASARGGFLTELTTIAALGADTIVLLLEGEALTAVIDQMALVGLTRNVVLAHPAVFATADPVVAPRDVPVFVPNLEVDSGENHATAATLWEAQGFDAVHMIATAAETLDTIDPALLASGLRTIVEYHGQTGRHVFDAHGRVTSKPITIRRAVAAPTVAE